MTKTIIATVLMIMLGPSLGHAQERPEDWEGDRVDRKQPVERRYRRNLGRVHDRGAFVRVNLGGAFTDSDAGGMLKNQGLALEGALAVGWLPFERLALHAGATGWRERKRTLITPTLGLTYFFADTHVYGSLSAGPTLVWDQRAVDQQLADSNNPAGIAMAGELAIGKLWWVERRWSMGLSLAGGLHGSDLDGDGTTFGGWRAGLRLEVLFN